MTTLSNAIEIGAPEEKVREIVADVGALGEYDPTVASVEVTSANPTGLGASRKVNMADGRHWFKEQLTVCERSGPLTFELTDCNFPIRSLRHTYAFGSDGGRTEVTQVMEYEVKFGLVGRLIDRIVLRRQFDAGVKKFLGGLEQHAERAA